MAQASSSTDKRGSPSHLYGIQSIPNQEAPDTSIGIFHSGPRGSFPVPSTSSWNVPGNFGASWTWSVTILKREPLPMFFSSSTHQALSPMMKLLTVVHRHACKWWTENLHQNASLLGTHDLGFMIFPWARVQWDLHRDQRAFDTMMKAANTLADRFSETTGCMRSWDKCPCKQEM